MEQTTQTPQGKGMAVAGFVIALVSLVFYIFVAGAVTVQAALGGGYGLGIFWLVLSLAGTGLCVMGMMKLGKTGGKKGLAIAGMIVGIVAVILTTMLVMSIGKMQEVSNQFGEEFKNELNKAMEQTSTEMQNEIQNTIDSTTATH